MKNTNKRARIKRTKRNAYNKQRRNIKYKRNYTKKVGGKPSFFKRDQGNQPLLSGNSGNDTNAQLSALIQELNRINALLTEENARLTEEKAQLTEENARLTEENKKITEKNEMAMAQITSLIKDSAKLMRSNGELEGQLQDLQDQLDLQESQQRVSPRLNIGTS